MHVNFTSSGLVCTVKLKHSWLPALQLFDVVVSHPVWSPVMSSLLAPRCAVLDTAMTRAPSVACKKTQIPNIEYSTPLCSVCRTQFACTHFCRMNVSRHKLGTWGGPSQEAAEVRPSVPELSRKGDFRPHPYEEHFYYTFMAHHQIRWQGRVGSGDGEGASCKG